jgi:hypothetical protein
MRNRYLVGDYDVAGVRGEWEARDKADAKQIAARLRTHGTTTVVIYDGERDGRVVDEASEEWLDDTA